MLKLMELTRGSGEVQWIEGRDGRELFSQVNPTFWAAWKELVFGAGVFPTALALNIPHCDRVFFRTKTECRARGGLGCALTHLACWVEAQACSCAYVGIFEDDCVFKIQPALLQRYICHGIQACEELGRPIDLLRLQSTAPRVWSSDALDDLVPLPDGKFLRRIDRSYGTVALIVRVSRIPSLIQDIFSKEVPRDVLGVLPSDHVFNVTAEKHDWNCYAFVDAEGRSDEPCGHLNPNKKGGSRVIEPILSVPR